MTFQKAGACRPRIIVTTGIFTPTLELVNIWIYKTMKGLDYVESLSASATYKLKILKFGLEYRFAKLAVRLSSVSSPLMVTNI